MIAWQVGTRTVTTTRHLQALALLAPHHPHNISATQHFSKVMAHSFQSQTGQVHSATLLSTLSKVMAGSGTLLTIIETGEHAVGGDCPIGAAQ